MDEQETAPSRGSPWLKRLGIGAGVLVLLLVIAGGATWWLRTRDFVSTDDAMVDGYIVQMAPQVGGRVTQLLVRDNQHVDAGQTLLLIDPRDLQARLDLAHAQHANAQAQLEQANAQVAVRQADVSQAEANARVAQAETLQARQDYERYTALDPHAVTRQQVDNATAAFRSAEAKQEAAAQTVTGAKAQRVASEAQVLAADAMLKQADANVASAELQLSYCTLVAPVAGTIARRTVDAGNTVNPGQALFALVRDERWVTANYKETQLAGMLPGQAVDLTIDAVPGATFRGRVDSIQAGTGSAFSVLPAENATGNYVKIVQRVPVKIVFDDGRLKDRLPPIGASVVPWVKVR